MSEVNAISSGRSKIGQEEAFNPPTRSIYIPAKEIVSASRPEPIPLFYGTINRSFTQIVPVYDIVTSQKKGSGKGGKAGGSGQTQYNFSWGGVIGWGPAYKLTKIFNVDKVVWDDGIDFSVDTPDTAENGYTINLTGELNGTIRFYPGVSSGSYTQAQDPDYTAFSMDYGTGTPVNVELGAYKKLIHFVADSIDMEGQTSPANLKFEITRLPVSDTPLNYVLPTASTHIYNNTDAYIPEIIYDLLSNQDYGAGISGLDTASFAAAQDTLVTEEATGLFTAVSPEWDSFTSPRQAVGDLLRIIDGSLKEENGTISLVLHRSAGASSQLTIDMSNLLAEPKIDNSLHEDVWNYTIVNFENRDNQYGDDSYAFDDLASFNILNQRIEKEINYNGIKKYEVAATVATREGINGGTPKTIYTAECMPSVADTLQQGEYASLNYTPLGINQLCRVVQVTRGGNQNLESRIKLLAVQDTDVSKFIPPAVQDSVSGLVDQNGKTDFEIDTFVPYVAYAPTGMHTNGSWNLNTIVTGQKPGINTLRVLYYSVAYGEAGSGLNATTKSPIEATEFPGKMEILWWIRGEDNRAVLRVKWDSQDDYNQFNTQYEANNDSSYLWVMQRRYDNRGSLPANATIGDPPYGGQKDDLRPYAMLFKVNPDYGNIINDNDGNNYYSTLEVDMFAQPSDLSLGSNDGAQELWAESSHSEGAYPSSVGFGGDLSTYVELIPPTQGERTHVGSFAVPYNIIGEPSDLPHELVHTYKPSDDTDGFFGSFTTPTIDSNTQVASDTSRTYGHIVPNGGDLCEHLIVDEYFYFDKTGLSNADDISDPSNLSGWTVDYSDPDNPNNKSYDLDDSDYALTNWGNLIGTQYFYNESNTVQSSSRLPGIDDDLDYNALRGAATQMGVKYFTPGNYPELFAKNRWPIPGVAKIDSLQQYLGRR